MMKIIESPREAMQGFHRIIPTGEKVRYIDHLLRTGFDTVEIGSIVSPVAVPNMADSLEVLGQLDLSGITTNRMFLAANTRGAEILAGIDGITHISYPFSFSPAFQKMNVNATVEQSLDTVKLISSLCEKSGKQAVIYISMAFGNPYGDPWNIDMLAEWIGKLHQSGIRIIPLSNVSVETGAAMIREVFSTLVPMFPDVEFGLHLHTGNQGWYEKVHAAYTSGCRRFDGVINGLGGCPMAGKEMLGNLKTQNLLEFASKEKLALMLDRETFNEDCRAARELFAA
ncbi:MAG: hydroxymethylglutaryl-CoA lyase [Bacteroidetes bacterium]|nr:hydroxymethylglutaryl-CoA lyase [Bacteroidota bacterium]